MITHLLLAVSVLAAPAPSDADKARARGLYEEGVGHFQGKNFAVAQDKFAAAYALDPSPILLYNLARAAEENGEADAAVSHYRAYLEKFPKAQDRPEVERRIRILDAVLRNNKRGSIVLVSAPDDAQVLINERSAGEKDERGHWRRDPGRYALTVRSPEGEFTSSVEVRAGEVSTVRWLAPAGEDHTLAIAGWSALGGGLVIAATGFVFYGTALTAEDDWNAAVRRIAGGDTSPAALKAKRDAKDDVEGNGNTAIALWAVGGAAALTGGGLLLYDALSGTKSDTAVLPTPGGAVFITTF